MPLPRGDEYNQAVQNPRISFSDVELKACHVETTPLGLPKPYSGGFTTTYKLKGTSQNWAVRCFTKEIQDLEQRYRSISNFFGANGCSFLVESKFLQDGIRINAQYFPVIKMRWLEGEPLNLYIEKNINNKAALNSILLEFNNLIKQLENFGIAHGDLQHGNIMVKNGKLFLIDYDGMFLPDLTHLPVNELGHPNFQHPRRSAKDYNNTIDRFSAMVIYTALNAAIINPNLWKKYDNGDNLLFKGSDFLNPNNSALLQDLAAYPELVKFANNIAAICTLEFKNIPSLSDFISKQITGSATILPTIKTVRSAYLVLDGSQKGKLLEHLGQKVEVVGQLSANYRKSTTVYGQPYVFLNIGTFPLQTFTIVVWAEGLLGLQLKGIPIDSLTNKWISITGVLSAYDGNPQISLDLSSQIQILGNKAEADARLNYNTIIQPPMVPVPPIPKKVKDAIDEDVFWNEKFKNKPVTAAPKVQVPSPSPAKANTSSSAPVSKVTSKSNTPTKGSNSSSNNENGCVFIIVGGIIGALVLGLLGGSAPAAIWGFIIGAGLVLLFTK